MAGDSAEDVARRAREKADRLIRRAEMFEKGAEGERIVAQLLAHLPPEWFVLHDIRWPGRDRANIDHVVVGPPGIFVIDAKNWSGNVTIARGVLRQNGYNRMNAIEGVATAAYSVAELVPRIDLQFVTPVICFVGAGRTRGTVRDVAVCDADSLLVMLQSRAARLSPEFLQFLRFDLDMSARSASGPSGSPMPSSLPPPVGRPLAPVGRYVSSPGKRAAKRHRAKFRSKGKVILQSVLMWFVACSGIDLMLEASGRGTDRAEASVMLVVTFIVVVVASGRLHQRR